MFGGYLYWAKTNPFRLLDNGKNCLALYGTLNYNILSIDDIFLLFLCTIMTVPETNVEVELLSAHGDLEWTFSPKIWQGFSEAASEAWLSISTSCCSGACFVCACRIIQWQEDVDIGLVSVPLVDIESDQVLTCVGWLKDQIFSDWKFHKIVLQKLV